VRTFIIFWAPFFFRIHEVVGLPLPLLLPEVGYHVCLVAAPTGSNGAF